MDPLSRNLMVVPSNSPQCENWEAMTAVPEVLCMNLPGMPMVQRVGISKLKIKEFSTAPVSMPFMTPPFFCISSIMTPWYSVGTSTATSSYGSNFLPVSGSSRNSTSGALTMNSKPSRRMFSIRMPSWSVPRPFTLKLSDVLPGSKRRAKFVRHSFSKRALIWTAVTFVDSFSCAANGDLLTENSMATVGSSTWIGGRGLASFRSTTVSPMVTSVRPAKAQMSPAFTLSILTRSLFSKCQSFVTLPLRSSPSSPYMMPISWPTVSSPETRRPMQIRPT
mmetsp:Transcript_146231/g.207334  ORF Transcript_146231/g.207334 Transcript_146231/m.207334 type:complete len:278 (-) Transcript_146231:943-1776(-)